MHVLFLVFKYTRCFNSLGDIFYNFWSKIKKIYIPLRILKIGLCLFDLKNTAYEI